MSALAIPAALIPEVQAHLVEVQVVAVPVAAAVTAVQEAPHPVLLRTVHQALQAAQARHQEVIAAPRQAHRPIAPRTARRPRLQARTALHLQAVRPLAAAVLADIAADASSRLPCAASSACPMIAPNCRP